MSSLDQVWAYWGCDHLEATCRDKFSNLIHHL
ncbi:MAG: phage BR0599 family protein [Candidatus Krumholzibacteriia bacterium]